ncbi:MAG: OmpH family outer membrane protein [Bacteroidales bacterium]|jgi:outer membrane protein|nr:OmpH family outer membrane protein [Bacteroidales bacterium]
MKKTSLWINIILILAVAGIYVLHFTGERIETKADSSDAQENVEGEVLDRNYSIAYVNIDTIISEYQFFVDKRADLNEKMGESEAELQLQSRNFEREVRDFQEQLNKGLITRTKAQMLQQELAQKEQQLYATRDNIAQQLSEEEQVMLRQGLDRIMKYLENYNKEHNYRYVLSKTFGSQVLYADKSLNITRDVLNGLNEQYQEENQEK